MDISTGGIRDRLIRDAAATMVRQGLVDLGWFAAGRQHAPLVWRDNPVTETAVEVPLNTLTVALEDFADDEIELGSTYSEERHTGYVDFYGESEDVSRAVMGDVRDLLRGKHPTVGRVAPVLAVYNTTEDPVPAEPAFILEIQNVELDWTRETSARVWEQFWWSCRFVLVDER